MTAVTQLDLTKPVTRAEYEDSIKRMIHYLEHDLKRRHDWCDNRWGYFKNVIPEFYAGAIDNVNFNSVPADANYNERLDVTRRKILWYARAGTISLVDANEIFAKGGLPEYGVDRKTGHRVRIGMPYLEANIGDVESLDDARGYVTEHWLDLIVSLLDGKPVEGSKYVPGSAVFDTSYSTAPSVENVMATSTIREEDTTHPTGAPTPRRRRPSYDTW
jgi:hypothetical protein